MKDGGLREARYMGGLRTREASLKENCRGFGETLLDAAEQLRTAGASEQPATLILVVTDSQQPASLFNVLPPDILLVNSAASELVERLD